MDWQKMFHTFGTELLGWTICSAGVFAGFLLQLMGAVNPGVLLDGEASLHMNPVWFGIGALLCFISFAAVWKLVLRKTLDEILQLERVWLLVWILLAVKSLFAQFMLFCYGMIFMIAFQSTPRPEWMTGFVIVYIFYVIIFIVVDMLLHKKREV